MSNKSKDVILNNYRFFLKCCIGMIIFVSALILLLVTVKYKQTLFYNESSNVDYKVYLKDNKYFEKEYLEQGKLYIPSSIKEVETNFYYNFTTENKSNYSYKYRIVATLLVDNTEGKNIYHKEYELKRSNVLTSVDHSFNIADAVKINYDEYNAMAKDFVSDYKLNDVDSKVSLTLFVSYDNNQEKNVSSLYIPLARDNDIEFTANNENNQKNTIEYNDSLVDSTILKVLGYIVLVINAISIVYILNHLKKTVDTKQKYLNELNRILTNYKDFICETKSTRSSIDMEKTQSLRVIRIKDFDGLAEVSDKVNQPILYHTRKNFNETLFYIYDGNLCYIYTLSINMYR